MLDVIYVLLTLAVFVLLALLVGLLDRHSGGSPSGPVEVAATGRSSDEGRSALAPTERGGR